MYNLYWYAHLIVAGISIVYSKYSGALYSSIGFAIIAYLATNGLIPCVTDSFLKVGLSGKDLSKPQKPILPEAIGAVAATVYLFGAILAIPFLFYKYLVVTSGGGHRDLEVLEHSQEVLVFPHAKLSEYLSAIICLQVTVLLGAVDDLFDLRWRHKIIFPLISVIPLLVVYYADFGVTYVLIPNFVREWLPIFGGRIVVDLGWLYYVYMASMSIFCSNAINILAGVNGLEVLQSIVIGVVCLMNDFIYMLWGSDEAKESHLLSIVMILPFLGVSLAIFQWNRWPAKVFVGDTYCYFAGMVFAVVGILGHFSKTILLFFVPQLFNFAYSVPQLLGLVFCPRHRLPRFNPEDGLMYPSEVDLVKNPSHPLVVLAMKILEFFHLMQLTYNDKGELISCNNMTLINLILVWLGPMREDRLCYTICGIQFLVGLFFLFMRHAIGALIFGQDNLWHIIRG